MSGHPNLAPEVNAAIEASEKAWGFAIKDLPANVVIEVQTQNTFYTIQKKGEKLTIQGHQKYCPTFVPIRVVGCTFGGSLVKLGHLFEGGYLKFIPLEGPYINRAIITSQIKTVRIR